MAKLNGTMDLVRQPSRDCMAKKSTLADLAATLRKAMKDSGLSWGELAHLSGLTVPQISHFQAGDKPLTLAQASRLCEALGLKLVKG